MQVNFEIPRLPALKTAYLSDLNVGEWFIFAYDTALPKNNSFVDSVNFKVFGFVSRKDDNRVYFCEVSKTTGKVYAERGFSYEKLVFPLNIDIKAQPQFA